MCAIWGPKRRILSADAVLLLYTQAHITDPFQARFCQAFCTLQRCLLADADLRRVWPAWWHTALSREANPRGPASLLWSLVSEFQWACLLLLRSDHPVVIWRSSHLHLLTLLTNCVRLPDCGAGAVLVVCIRTLLGLSLQALIMLRQCTCMRLFLNRNKGFCAAYWWTLSGPRRVPAMPENSRLPMWRCQARYPSLLLGLP